MPRPKEDPRLDAGVRGWIVNYSKRHLWRVPEWYTLQDLVQDGYVEFYRCCERYPDVEQRHLMALFKRVFANRVTDLSCDRTRLHETAVSQCVPDGAETSFFEKALGAESDLTVLAALFVKAPQEILDALWLLVSDAGQLLMDQPGEKSPDGQRETTRHKVARILMDRIANEPGEVRANGTRETKREKMRRLCGYDPCEVDVIATLRQYLEA